MERITRILYSMRDSLKGESRVIWMDDAQLQHCKELQSEITDIISLIESRNKSKQKEEEKVEVSITAEEFIREKIRQKLELKGDMKGLHTYLINGEDALRWAHEFATMKVKEHGDGIGRNCPSYGERFPECGHKPDEGDFNLHQHWKEDDGCGFDSKPIGGFSDY